MQTESNEVLYDVADHIAVITLNAPERMNTISSNVANAETVGYKRKDPLVAATTDRESFGEILNNQLDENVQGVQVHDLRLVAWMQVHGISHLLTLNQTDFARYSGVVAQSPQDVVGSVGAP